MAKKSKIFIMINESSTLKTVQRTRKTGNNVSEAIQRFNNLASSVEKKCNELRKESERCFMAKKPKAGERYLNSYLETIKAFYF